MRKIFRQLKLGLKHGYGNLFDANNLLRPDFAVTDFNLLLHNLRTLALRDMPKGAEVFLSAGCAGTWYFDWILDNYGPVQEHIGIEYYSPKPADLPANVRWIENTVSDMSAVPENSADLAFSGQNVEHLWPDELLGALLETRRTLKPGGVAVIDSPNRSITSGYKWNHPEHIMELTVPEIEELMDLAGFEEIRTKGIWLCFDNDSESLLPLTHSDGNSQWSATRRIAAAAARPEDSFIWWAEGRKGLREPDTAKLKSRIDEIFRVAWHDRVQRMKLKAASTTDAETGIQVVNASHKSQMLRGPHMPLRAGKHSFEFSLRGQSNGVSPDKVVAWAEVYVPSKKEIVAKVPIPASRVQGGEFQPVDIEFSLDKLEFGVQYRLHGTGAAPVSALAEVTHSPHERLSVAD